VAVDRIRRLCFALVLVVSLVVLFTPDSAVPVGPAGTDKVVHVALFAALTYTGVLAGLAWGPATVAMLGYAAVSEVVQALPDLGRSASVADWAADAVGVAVGLAAVFALRRTRRWWAPPARAVGR